MSFLGGAADAGRRRHQDQGRGTGSKERIHSGRERRISVAAKQTSSQFGMGVMGMRGSVETESVPRTGKHSADPNRRPIPRDSNH